MNSDIWFFCAICGERKGWDELVENPDTDGLVLCKECFKQKKEDEDGI